MCAIHGGVPRLQQAWRQTKASSRDVNRALLLGQLNPEDERKHPRMAAGDAGEPGRAWRHTDQVTIRVGVPRGRAEPVELPPVFRVPPFVLAEAAKGGDEPIVIAVTSRAGG